MTEQLVTYPYRGRASEREDVRELLVHRHYLVSYRVRRDRVEILQVWHTAQDRRRLP
jgi:plasmid stabilization system protein ParE